MLVSSGETLLTVEGVSTCGAGPPLMGLSELGSRQLQKQAIVIFASVLRECESRKVAVSCFLFSSFLKLL